MNRYWCDKVLEQAPGGPFSYTCGRPKGHKGLHECRCGCGKRWRGKARSRASGKTRDAR
jgi:hypothetical protein